MKKYQQIPICLAVFFVTLAVLAGCLLLTAVIPNEAIADRMQESALTYKDKEAYGFTDGQKLNAIADNYADVILLQISMNMGRAPLRSAFETEYYDGGEYGQSLGLYFSLTDPTVTPNVDYTRYWHGSAMFVRVFHLFGDVELMKTVGFAALCLLAAGVCLVLIKRRHYDLAAAFFLSCLSVHIWNLRLSLEYQSAFLIGFAACLLFLFWERRGDWPLVYLSVAVGVCTSFFDFLTTETVTILLPLVLVVAVRAREGRLGDFRSALWTLIRCGIGWIGAYAATFVAKWTVATVVSGENKFLLALSSAGERMTGEIMDAAANGALARAPMAVLANLSAWFGTQNERIDVSRVVIVLLVSVLLFGSVLYLFKRTRLDASAKNAVGLLSLLSAVVLLRYVLLANHSYMHCFFTYRALITVIFSVFAALLFLTEVRGKKQKSRGGRG